MKLNSTVLLAKLSQHTLSTLTTQVEETIACNTVVKKVFTAADLWNIQRQRKNFAKDRSM